MAAQTNRQIRLKQRLIGVPGRLKRYDHPEYDNVDLDDQRNQWRACTAAVVLSDGFKEIGGKIKLRDHPHGPWSDFQRAGLQTPRYVSPLCRSIR
jgi:hypothetical protein